MPRTFLLIGKLTRDYVLPPVGEPRLDSPGGNVLYAAGGLAVWSPPAEAALISRVAEDYPHQWLQEIEGLGYDSRGIRILHEEQNMELRNFIAYGDNNERSHSNIVFHFARRQITFPKALLGFQPVDESALDPRELEVTSPSALDVPKKFWNIRHVHICPFDFVSQSQMVHLFRSGSNHIVSLDPASIYMKPGFGRDLRLVLQGVTIFQPSEEDLRSLFKGETKDLWEMAGRVSEYGPQIVVIKRGTKGQMVFDAAGKRRYEIPAHPSRVSDPTGVGDAFCGGFLAGYERTSDPLLSALYGNVSASLKIEGSGPFYPLDVLPGLAEARLHSLKELVREI